MIYTTIIQLLLYISVFLMLLVSIAYLTLLERKIMGSIQRRRGPNVAGIFGLLQPFADGVKLLLKETIIPSTSNGFLFLCSPLFTFFCSIMLWMVVPFGEGMVYSDLPYSLLYIFAISSLSVYGILFAGWSSNSKYAFLGGLRSAAQMISYEICIGFILISVILLASSANLTDIVLYQNYVWFIFPLFPMWLVFVICSLAETNRAPFDLPEAEAELVAGYNVEYSGITFALFFLGEYANILFMSVFSALLFFGGWLPPFDFLSFIPGVVWLGLKFSFNVFIFVWVRASFPRFRYDQLMKLGWKVFLPFTLAFVVIQSAIVFILMYI